ncbi:hypothetical protein [Falsirhodobacter sp. 20TX0035]|uniref:hypothetical protein n=1 Tax=Falsirhodobacter sp. 20TX0035 TaxID=3022019 RepID=UPI00232E7464|nr:hypothetical protein [Falsirhodobacter sp. 20TX0035]MDB6454331.1 hypothetical protein [Falsirhodobacter sp. 20TX0035]
MKRTILALLAASLATPVLADPKDHHDRRDPPGHTRIPPGHDKDRKWDRDHDRHNDRDRQHAREHDRDRDRRHDRGLHVGEYARHGHALSRDQLRRLPPLPRGQEYRRIDDNIVRIDSDTLKIVAVLGLVSALLAMR